MQHFALRSCRLEVAAAAGHNILAAWIDLRHQKADMLNTIHIFICKQMFLTSGVLMLQMSLLHLTNLRYLGTQMLLQLLTEFRPPHA